MIIINILSCNLLAQNAVQISAQQQAVQAPTNSQSTLLSAQPSAQELTNYFVSASGTGMNPLDAVALVANQGENAVPGLTCFFRLKTAHFSA